MNKQIFLIVLFFSCLFVNAQTAIGKNTVDGASTILDFYDSADNVKGIILPALTTAPTINLLNGTFYFDKTDKKVKMRQNGLWVDLSEVGDSSSVIENLSAEVITSTDNVSIIGAKSSYAFGVLVLESPNKAMILPKIASPQNSVSQPYPGMMCYDTVSKSLAVFDGSAWNFWKAMP